MTLLKAYLRGETDPISLTKAFAEGIIEKAHRAIEEEVEKFFGIGMSWKEFVSDHEKLMTDLQFDIDAVEYDYSVLRQLSEKPEKSAWAGIEEYELTEEGTPELLYEETAEAQRKLLDLKATKKEAEKNFSWHKKEYKRLLKQVSGYESLEVAKPKEVMAILDIGIELLENELKIAKDTAEKQNILSRRDTKWLKERKKRYEKTLTQLDTHGDKQIETSKYHKDLERYFKESRGKKIGEKKHSEALIKNLETRLEKANEQRNKAETMSWKEFLQSAGVLHYKRKEREVGEGKDSGISEFSLKNPHLVVELAEVLYDKSIGKGKILGEKLLEIIGKLGDEIDKPLKYDSFKGEGGTSDRRAFGYKKTASSKKRTPVSPVTLIANYRELIEILEKGKKDLEWNPQEEFDLNRLLKNLNDGIEKQQKRKEKEGDEPEPSTRYGERRYDEPPERKELTEKEIRGLVDADKFIANLLSNVDEDGDEPKELDNKSFVKLLEKLQVSVKGITREDATAAELIEFGGNYNDIANMVSRLRLNSPPSEDVNKIVRDWIRYRDAVKRIPNIDSMLGEPVRGEKIVRDMAEERDNLELIIDQFRNASDRLFDNKKDFENRTHMQISDEDWEKEVKVTRERLDGEQQFRTYMSAILTRWANKEALNKIFDRIINGQKIPEKLLKDVIREGAIKTAASTSDEFASYGKGGSEEQRREIKELGQGAEMAGRPQEEEHEERTEGN